MRALQLKSISLMMCFMLCACVMQAQSVEFIRENIPGIGVNKTIMNNNGELLLAGIRGGNPSVMKMDTLGNVIWHKTFYDEPVRNNSNNQWHFWDLRADLNNNVYLYAEQIYSAHTPPPRITKLDNEGNLIWASDDLPPAFEYEPNINTWLHVGDTTLTISYMAETVALVHLNTGEVLGKDSLLSSTWIRAKPHDIYFEEKEYRESGLGFLAFDKSGEYTIKLNPLNKPQPIRHIDSSGYYLILNSILNSIQGRGFVTKLQLYDFEANLINEKIIFNEETFDHEDSLSNSQSFAGYFFHPTRGIIVYGNSSQWLNADMINPEIKYHGNWFAQVRPSDFKILFDTIIDRPRQWSSVHFAFMNDIFILQGDRSHGGRNAYIMKINLKDVDEYPASFVTEKQQKTNTIKIYPNPSSTGEFIIQSQKESITKVDVFTMTGQIVYSQKVNALQETLQMDTKGIYLVRVTTNDNQTETLKIVNQ